MTSIEWLINELVKADKILDGHRKNEDSTIIKLNPTKIFEQAKEMHKSEHEETFKQSRMAKIFEKDMPPLYENFEQYYNETFKKD